MLNFRGIGHQGHAGHILLGEEDACLKGGKSKKLMGSLNIIDSFN